MMNGSVQLAHGIVLSLPDVVQAVSFLCCTGHTIGELRYEFPSISLCFATRVPYESGVSFQLAQARAQLCVHCNVPRRAHVRV